MRSATPQSSARTHCTAMAALMRFMRELCGRGWIPSDIFLPYAKPDDVAHHRSFFKVLPHFSAGFCALRFPVQQLSMPVVGADLRRGQAAVHSHRRIRTCCRTCTARCEDC